MKCYFLQFTVFFLMKPLKLQKMSDWNELSSRVGKWKFCRIYWQWILIEQTFLYMVVYRTFLYNPTNLKVPKKAPCSILEFPIDYSSQNGPLCYSSNRPYLKCSKGNTSTGINTGFLQPLLQCKKPSYCS